MRCILLPAALFVSALSLSASDYYKFSNVKKVDNNLYSGQNGVSTYLIETSLCLHLTLGEDAALRWDGFSGTIIWEDNSTCAVKQIMQR